MICLDEMGKNLLKEKHPDDPAKPGQIKREDYTYERKGAGNVFVACEPLAGQRYLKVSRRRTRKDWAYFIHHLLTEPYAQAEQLVLVMDNLNTHSPASLYEVFPPAEAKALADRLEIHYTPKHASWLNMAEIELSVLVRQGLAHNIATIEEFRDQAERWQQRRNQAETTVNWQFTTADARIKLKRLYPVLHETKQEKRGSVTHSAPTKRRSRSVTDSA
jgi:hypothetical protein